MNRILVVGQGLAGSWLAWWLLAEGVDVVVVDPAHAITSSRVAAGLINPITGRRLHTNWRGKEVTALAYDAYADVERALHVDVLRRYDLRRIFRDADAPAIFRTRMASDEFEWLSIRGLDPGTHDDIEYPYGGFEVEAATVDTVSFLDAIRRKLHVVTADVDDAWLRDHQAEYDAVVWCDGWTAQFNPLWSWLPFAPVKGEILDVHVPGLQLDHILSSNIWMIPVGHERYRLGSTYDWDDLTDTPTDAARATLLWQAESMIKRPITVEGHRAAVRPASHTRRPYVGRHPRHTEHYILNGLGTKGSLLAPWTAQQLASHLVHATPLDPEIDITQWWRP